MRRATVYNYLARKWDWLKRQVRRFANLLRPVTILCVAAFTLFTFASAIKLPKQEWWDKDHVLPWIFLGTGVVTAVRQTVVSLDRRQRKRTTALNEACRQIAAHLDDHCPNLRLRQIGIHVWRVAGPSFSQHLKREAKFLIRDRRGSSVPWTRGKGVFGRAWEERSPVIVDLETELYPYATSEEEFMALPEKTRLGLSWDELNRTKHYKTIYAAPLFSRASADAPKILGLVAVDVSEPDHFDDLYHALVQNQDFNSILGICEGALVG